MSGEAQVSDLEFMQDPMRWPMFVLPLKQRKTGRLGVLNGGGPIVFTVNMYELDGYKGWKEVPHTEYKDFEAIVDDGWVVD